MQRASSRQSIYVSSAFKFPSIPDIFSMATSATLRRFTAKSLLDTLDLTPDLSVDDFWEKVSLLNEEQYQIFIILVFRRDPGLRTEIEVSFLENLMRNYSFFKDLRSKISLESYREFFKELRYESHRKGTVLFNFGEIGKKFYLVLKGSVYVLVPKAKNKILMDQTLTKLKLDSKASFSKEFSKEFKPLTDEDKLLERYPNMYIANVLKEGMLFGEISLSLKEPRTATVICKEDCNFGVLSAYNYDRILKNNYEIELKFLKKTSLFHEFSLPNLAILKGYFQEINFNKDSIIYRQNEPAENIFIVKEGEIELLHVFSKNNQEESTDLNKKPNNKTRPYSLGKLGIGESFGEEETFLEKPRLYTTKVSSLKATILFISRENLFLNLKSLKSLNIIQEKANKKLIWRSNQIKKLRETLIKAKQKEENPIPKPLPLQNFLQAPSEENKTALMQTLSLKHIKKSPRSPIIENGWMETPSNQPYSLYFTIKANATKKSPKKRGAFSEEKEKTLKNYEISEILKIAAVSTALSTMAKSKRKFSLPNVKQMIINYENETKKAIENSVQKKDASTSTKTKEFPNYLKELHGKHKEHRKFLAQIFGLKNSYYLKNEWKKDKKAHNKKEEIFSVGNQKYMESIQEKSDKNINLSFSLFKK